MKVICIQSNLCDSITLKDEPDCIIEGHIYTVIDTVAKTFYGKTNTYYGLAEINNGKTGFDVDIFIPVSEIDETEMIREYNTVTKT